MIYDDENFFYKCLQTLTHPTKSLPRTHPYTIFTHEQEKTQLYVCLSVCVCMFVCACVWKRKRKDLSVGRFWKDRYSNSSPVHNVPQMREGWFWCVMMILDNLMMMFRVVFDRKSNFPVLLLKQNKRDVKWNGRARTSKQLEKFSVLFTEGEKVHVFI